MSANPLRPVPGASSVESRVLSDAERVEVDRLYWDQSEQPLPVRDIAERFDLPARGVHHFVTPWPSSLTCLLCGAAGICTSRSQRASGVLTCSECGGPIHSRVSRYSAYWNVGAPPAIAANVIAEEVDAVPVAHAMVRRRLGDRQRDLGNEAHRAVSALARAGRPFLDGRTVLVLEPHDGIEEIQSLLAAQPVSTLAVASLRTLGDSQVEAMQNLLFLTHDGWRVVSACDVHAWSRREARDWYDDEYTWPSAENSDAHWDDARSSVDDHVIDAAHRFASRLSV